MSHWTHINGMIKVSPLGRTQPEKRYILDTVLEHLPLVTGSEGDMETYVIQKNWYNSSCSCDEFNNCTNLGVVDSSNSLRHDRNRGWFRTQDTYFVVVEGDFRDRKFNQTLNEFNKWINRLSKRVLVEDVLVRLYDDCGNERIFTNKNDTYSEMFVYPIWSFAKEDGDENNWCEYLMWRCDEDELKEKGRVCLL